MVDTPVSAPNAQSLTSARRTAASLPVPDDDDEPPSSGRRRQDPQVTRPAPLSLNIPSKDSYPPIISRDKLSGKVDVEYGFATDHDSKDEDDEDGRAGTTTGDNSTLGNDEDIVLRVPRTPRGPRAWYHRLRIPKNSKLRVLFTPAHEIGPRPTYAQSFQAALFYSYLNLLLLFIPISWGLHFAEQSATLVFAFSCLAIIPLAALLGLGTEQIALRTSQSVGGLLNATLGNVVEMIIGGIALSKCELELVQSSLLGGQLSNLLLVLGCSFLVGGFRFQHSEFQPMVAQLNASLLIVSVISFFIPVGFHSYLETRLPQGAELPFLLRLSHGSAIILLLMYFAYLFFQFYSHSHLFIDMDAQSSDSSSKSSTTSNRPVHRHPLGSQMPSTASLAMGGGGGGLRVPSRGPAGSANDLFASRVSLASAIELTPSPTTTTSSHTETLKLNLPSALALLGLVTVLVYFTADHLVDSLEGLLQDHPSISKKWITLIVIPVVGNAAEYATAVLVASKGKFNLSMSVAVGSCIQIAFFVVPVLVLVAWGVGKPLTLLFEPLETFALFFSVLVVKFTVEDGRSHWLNGLALISVYTLFVLSFWGFPDTTRLIQGQPIVCIR